MDTLPQFYRETFFSRDTIFYTEHGGHNFGVAGDPVPYSLRGDSLLTLLLIVCFVILVISVSQSQRFIVRQLKYFFYTPHNDSNISETSAELRFQIFLAALSSLLLGIVTYQYATQYVANSFVIEGELTLIVLFSAVFLAFFVGQALIYQMVNSVFFETSQNTQWQKVLLFDKAMTGVFLFPAVLLMVYFDLSLSKAAYYFFFVLIFFKIVTFYKGWSIFFRQKSVILQTFLYFCTLEITPLLCLASGLVIFIDKLKLNF